MKVTYEKLQEIILSHGKWLRKEECGSRASLCCADLDSANLSGADLSNADLFCADLSNADLFCADLSSADLSGANLGSADLSGADLSGANLGSADLSNANLRHANLRHANLRRTNLDSANLSGADLSNANLSSARLDKTYYQIARIGRRRGTTTYCVDNDNVLCGCWNSTLDEFKERVESVYGSEGNNPNDLYYCEYMAAIKFFESVREINKVEIKNEI